jgi:UDP-N-acetylmuramate--alanine ligase
LAAIAVAHLFNSNVDEIIKSISKFTGVRRRFEIMGEYNDALIIDDYAHHPTEIKATLATAKKIKGKKIRCVFQPHTYSRTATLLHEFSNSFNEADEIIITDIYAAREMDEHKVHSKDLVNEIKKFKKNVKYIADLDDVVKYFKETAKENELIISIGAGDVRKVSENLI